MKRQFDLGAVLSVLHGVLLCPMGEVYKILNFMTADNLYTTQLPRASDECKPWIFRQHPQLEEVDVSDIGRDNWEEKLATLKEKYGETLEVEPIR